MGRPKGSKNERPLKLTIWLNQFNGIMEYKALDAEQRGVLLSIFIAYAQNGWLPSDTCKLAGACDLTVEEIERALPGLTDYIDADGDWLTVWYVDAEMKRMANQTKKGKDGAKARWEKDTGTGISELNVPEEIEVQEDGVSGNAESKRIEDESESETESKGKPVDKNNPISLGDLMPVPRAKVITPPADREISRFIDDVERTLGWDVSSDERTAWTRSIRLCGFDGGIAGRDSIMRARELGEPIEKEKHYFSKCLTQTIPKIA